MLEPEAVYILASRPRGALYTGRTKDLIRRHTREEVKRALQEEGELFMQQLRSAEALFDVSYTEAERAQIIDGLEEWKAWVMDQRLPGDGPAGGGTLERSETAGAAG